jgi:hypothetical protein
MPPPPQREFHNAASSAIEPYGEDVVAVGPSIPARQQRPAPGFLRVNPRLKSKPRGQREARVGRYHHLIVDAIEAQLRAGNLGTCKRYEEDQGHSEKACFHKRIPATVNRDQNQGQCDYPKNRHPTQEQTVQNGADSGHLPAFTLFVSGGRDELWRFLNRASRHPSLSPVPVLTHF